MMTLLHVEEAPGTPGQMTDLAADLAHELSQPLAAANNFLAAARMLIERGEYGARLADVVRQGEAQTRRAAELIRNIRDFAITHAVELRGETLSDMIEEACGLVLPAQRYGVEIVVDVDPAAEDVLADRIQIEQVLVNLLRNAAEALAGQKARRRITIAARSAGSRIEISVADNGPGLPAALANTLGSRFVSSKGSGGMGLGLSISRRIIEAHGNALTAGNQPAGGAIFHFSLRANRGLKSC